MTLRLAILTALDRVDPFLLPHTTLWGDANMTRGGSPSTPTEFRIEVEKLEVARQIVSVRDADGALRYRITDDGLAQLASER